MNPRLIQGALGYWCSECRKWNFTEFCQHNPKKDEWVRISEVEIHG